MFATGDGTGRSAATCEPVEQALFERGRAGERDAGEKAGVEAQRDGDDADEHRDAEAAPDPFADAERALHRGEHPPADQQRQRQRCRRARPHRRSSSDVSATLAPLKRRAGQDQPQHRPGAGRPQQARRDAEQQRRQHRRTVRVGALIGGLRQPCTQRDQRARQPVGQRGEQQRDAEHRQQRQRGDAAVLVGLHRPAAADGRQRRHRGEGRRHADQHRQAAAEERPVGPREHERQHRQDARADDGQNAAEIGQQEQDHGRVLSRYQAAAGLNVSATPFMQ